MPGDEKPNRQKKGRRKGLNIEDMTTTEYIIGLISVLIKKCKTLEEFQEAFNEAIGKK